MNVLSLFDGISCGQVALERAGIKVNNYYASEIDKYAIQVTQKNYPNTIQIGDVEKIDFNDYIGKIDLLIGGSPCQGFSFAGKQLNFMDTRSRLFFKYVEALETIKPKYFLLENVKMKKEYQDVISKYMSVEPIMINSSLLSAQSRERNYWTNIPGITQPEDKGIVTSQILESGIACNFEKQGKYIKKINVDKSLCLLARDYKGFGNQQMIGVVEVGKAEDINGHDFLKRIYSPYGKSPTLTAVCGGNQERKIAVSETEYRMLTPLEYERLQTLPDNYTEGISNTQRYKALGNGWTVDIIAHIFKGLKEA